MSREKLLELQEMLKHTMNIVQNLLEEDGVRKPITPNYDAAQDFFSTDEEIKNKETENNPKTKRKKVKTFKEKFDAGDVDSFTARDMVSLFAQTAREQGIKYIINWGRDVSMVKKLLENTELDKMDIVRMIEFLFYSDQDYLDKSSIGPSILTSGWMNKIYQDSLLWVIDWRGNIFLKNQQFATLTRLF